VAGFSLTAGRSSSWAAARRRLARASRTVEGKQWLAVKRAALLAEREIKKGLQSGKPGGTPFPPLAETTRLLRRGTKPLLDTASLLGSIKSVMDEKRRQAFVGVLRTARGREGEPLVNVAMVHEFGTGPFVIPVTPAVRRLFWALHFRSNGRIKPLSPTKTEIMHPGVPKRAFIRPTVEAITPRLQEVIATPFTEQDLI